MAKFNLSKLNRWVTPLVLVSIGLHGLVLALPMPSLETPLELPEPSETETIQVVTLPKLARSSETSNPPMPEQPELPPEDPPFVEAPVEEFVLADPELIDELEQPDEWVEEEEDYSESGPETDGADMGADEEVETDAPTLEQRLASLDSYTNFDGTRLGEIAASGRLSEIAQAGGEWPSPLRSLEQALSTVDMPLQECLDDPPGTSVSVMVEVGPEGALIGEPELLNSAGYDVLDERVLEIARTADYDAYHQAGKTKTYSYTVQIDYEACNVADLADTETTG
ncbi:MAG: energy transducer TonB [Cyanobacteria bacterium P01_H01_bin.21]